MAARVSVRANTGVTLDLYVLDCPKCGVVFAISDEYDDRRRKDGESFYCPNNHSMSYTPGKSAETKLKEAEAREIALQDQLRAAVRDAEETRVQLLRDRARFANGVCPCCNRFFDNVKRHMTSKHPEYREAAKAPVYKCSCGRRFASFRGLRVHQGSQRTDKWDSPKTSRYWAHLTEV